jgi:shikimate kinase
MTDGGTESRRRTVALIGLRGSGKSTVGQALADLLGGQCIDTDDLVVQVAGKSIAAIFEEEGEDGFRRREREAVRQVLADPPAVISLGGGVVLDQENVQALRKVAKLVWLTARADVLKRRIAADATSGESRPDLTDRGGPDEIEVLWRERSVFYERAADLIVDTSVETPPDIARNILARLDQIDPA